ncbi:MAG: hypothetical protein PQ612_05920 [Rickettsiales bacterium]|nr:hypothetical protein [Pseudomonadota bacterium]MDA0966860.1 hypothetical protein [Pseudomonadota bacterium]MDG4543535.1 hypothetical protein [Rickettsiales bacterium]MDG4545683.1 hypothetical protein [Rickettsiales bacterium]MDG4547544.1 hypothetical protein [Rickettsiales bacterium]
MVVDTDGMVELWQAVILQAVLDARAKVGDSKREAKRFEQKKEAIGWLTQNSDDFKLVCMYAQLDSVWIRKRAKTMFFFK